MLLLSALGLGAVAMGGSRATSAAATPLAGCAALCGEWALDAERSPPPEPVVEAALQRWKEPPPRRPRRAGADAGDPLTAVLEEPDEPGNAAARRDAFAAELRARLSAPARLTFSTEGRDLVVAEPAGARRYRPDEPHAWIDAYGTANIETRWQRGQLVVEERYDRKRWTRVSYTVAADGSTLTVTRLLRRPGLDEVALAAVYRREQAPAQPAP